VAVLQQSLTGRNEDDALELEDIQHFLMSRPPARAARYEFLTFRSAACGRAWLMGLIDKVCTAKAVGSNLVDSRWATIGFTWNGLQALGVDEASLATFPEEFRQGMAARAEILGTTQHFGELDLVRHKYDEAGVLFAQVVTIREATLGPEHPELANVLSRLAMADLLRGYYAEAEPPCLRALAILQKVSPPDYPALIEVLRNYAYLLRKTNRNAQAELLETRAMVYSAKYQVQQ
jgi:hypothetical protein